MIIDMVLATDMSKHFEHVSKFVNGINKAVLRVDTESNGVSLASFTTVYLENLRMIT